MKKLLVVVLALALLCAMPLNASAITVGNGGSDSANVKGTYVPGGTSSAVYSVDITWGSMEFTYTAASEGTWNPQTHAYDSATPAAWSFATGANEITVTNHSNAQVTATFKYTPDAAFSAVKGTFSEESVVVESAVNTTYATAPAKTVTLTLEGAITESNNNIGTVTVTIAGN